jgi:hypothetical protein
MADLCSCETGFGNLGYPNCVDKFGIARRDIYVSTFDSDGNRNYIDPTVAIDDTFLEERLNDPDVTKRWYLSPSFKAFTSEKADTEYEEFTDGSKERIRKGVRTRTYSYVKKSTVFLDKLSQNECGDLSVFSVSDNGSIMGLGEDDGFLYPIKISAFDTTWMEATDEAVEKVMASYDFDVSVFEGDIRFILGSEIDANFDNYQGLLDVYMTDVSNISGAGASGTFDSTFKFSYGSYGNEFVLEGLELTDVSSLVNTTISNSYDG